MAGPDPAAVAALDLAQQERAAKELKEEIARMGRSVGLRFLPRL